MKDRRLRQPASNLVASPHHSVPSRGARFDRLDTLRGIALVWMAVFHFCFDLSNWQLIDANFYRDPLWTIQRTGILSLFLLCAGAGQAVALHQGQGWARFGKRWAQVLGCALLVSLGSSLMFPHSYIYFGVLHGMALMLLIARLSAPLGPWLWGLGALAVALPWWVQHPAFDTRLTDWVGLYTHKPITEDHVPLLPWLGVMWWGMAATQWLLLHRPALLGATAVAAPGAPQSGTSGDNTGLAPKPPAPWRWLAALGRWSLTFYMVHQPLLIGLLAAWMWLTGRAMP